MRVELSKSFTFEAAHRLPTFPEGHKCRRLHGHSFQVEVRVAGELDERRGYLVDYGDIKAACEPVREALDHRFLNEIKGIVWNHCVLCGRCYCPIGVHVPSMIAFARSICRSQDVYPETEEGRVESWL